MNNIRIHLITKQFKIVIIPFCKIEKITLLNSSDIGPFNPRMTLIVPLWIAIDLKKRNKCKIIIPEWLNYDSLFKALKDERAQIESLTKLPNYNIFEIVQLLIKEASDDIMDCERIRSLIDDIKSIRATKINKSFKNINLNDINNKIELTHFTSFEIEEYRNVVQLILKTYNDLKKETTSKTRLKLELVEEFNIDEIKISLKRKYVSEEEEEGGNNNPKGKLVRLRRFR